MLGLGLVTLSSGQDGLVEYRAMTNQPPQQTNISRTCYVAQVLKSTQVQVGTLIPF